MGLRQAQTDEEINNKLMKISCTFGEMVLLIVNIFREELHINIDSLFFLKKFDKSFYNKNATCRDFFELYDKNNVPNSVVIKSTHNSIEINIYDKTCKFISKDNTYCFTINKTDSPFFRMIDPKNPSDGFISCLVNAFKLLEECGPKIVMSNNYILNDDMDESIIVDSECEISDDQSVTIPNREKIRLTKENVEKYHSYKIKPITYFKRCDGSNTSNDDISTNSIDSIDSSRSSRTGCTGSSSTGSPSTGSSSTGSPSAGSFIGSICRNSSDSICSCDTIDCPHIDPDESNRMSNRNISAIANISTNVDQDNNFSGPIIKNLMKKITELEKTMHDIDGYVKRMLLMAFWIFWILLVILFVATMILLSFVFNH
jgi:hypothetical protein